MVKQKMKRKKPKGQEPEKSDSREDIWNLDKNLADPKFAERAMHQVKIRRQLKTVKYTIAKLEKMRLKEIKKNPNSEKVKRIEELLKSLRNTEEGGRKIFFKE